jgi:bifunctional non-homologous end joining protein LigD
LHVVAPLKPKAAWPAVKTFCRDLARSMASDAPDRYVATITKSKRQGKILIDYLRNQRGATAVAAYSTRARPGAQVSAPVTWEELASGARPKTSPSDNADAPASPASTTRGRGSPSGPPAER